MVEQSRTQFHIDTAGGVGKYVAAQTAEGGFEDHHRQQAGGDDIQGGQALMHQHLVHDHLEEQRCHQCEQLQDKGNHHDFAQQLSVFDDGRDEPGEVEARVLPGQCGFGTNQQQPSAPSSLQLVKADHLGSAGARILDQGFSLIQFGDDKKTAVTIRCNRR
ncbi:hypothetical protein D3C84_625770 [compost metagenome]